MRHFLRDFLCIMPTRTGDDYEREMNRGGMFCEYFLNFLWIFRRPGNISAWTDFSKEVFPHEPKNGTIRGTFPHELEIHFPHELNLRQRAASANPNPTTKPTTIQSIQNAADRPTSWFSHIKPPQASTNTKSRHPHPLLSFFLSLSLSILLFLLLSIINNPFIRLAFNVMFCPVLRWLRRVVHVRPSSAPSSILGRQSPPSSVFFYIFSNVDFYVFFYVNFYIFFNVQLL